jgi:hypothetical protein
MAEVVSGGCQCGRIRYTATIRDDSAYLCHCRMCQRATGGVSIAFKNVAKRDVAWERRPDLYASSPIARRGFCRECGTPISFEFPDGDNLDLTIGSFDEPARFRPHHHFGVESWHPQWLDTRGLPEYRADEHPPTVERWKNALGPS